MPSRCCVDDCRYGSTTVPKEKDVYFHRFPKNEELARKWIRLCKRNPPKDVPKHIFICSTHFAEDAYERSLYHELLEIRQRQLRFKPEAIPTLHLPTDQGKSQELKLSKTEQKMDSLMSFTYDEGLRGSFDRGGLPPHTSKYRHRLESFFNGEETNMEPDESSTKAASSTHTSVGDSASLAPPAEVYIMEGKNVHDTGEQDQQEHTADTEAVYVKVEEDEVLVKEEINISEEDTLEADPPTEHTHNVTHTHSPHNSLHVNNKPSKFPRGSRNGREIKNRDNSPPGAEGQPNQRSEIMEELKEMKCFMREMSDSLKGIRRATADIATSLREIAATRNGFGR